MQVIYARELASDYNEHALCQVKFSRSNPAIFSTSNPVCIAGSPITDTSKRDINRSKDLLINKISHKTKS